MNDVTLISGSSRGIGLGIAAALLQRGDRIVLNGRDQDALAAASDQLLSQGPHDAEVLAIAADIKSTAVICKVLDRAQDHFGQTPSTVVANLGSGRSQAGWDIDDKEWERMLELNLLASIRLSRESMRRMINSGQSGSITAIASIAGLESLGAPSPYATAKAALLAYVKATADQVAEHGIRINAVSPGNIDFEGGTWERKRNEDPQAVATMLRDRVPQNRFGHTQDIGEAVAFLTSKQASFITGSNLVVDGGQVRRIG